MWHGATVYTIIEMLQVSRDWFTNTVSTHSLYLPINSPMTASATLLFLSSGCGKTRRFCNNLTKKSGFGYDLYGLRAQGSAGQKGPFVLKQ